MPNDAVKKFNSAIKKQQPIAQAVLAGLQTLDKDLNTPNKFANFFITKLLSEEKQSLRNTQKNEAAQFVQDYIQKITYNGLSVLDIIKDEKIKTLPKGEVREYFEHVYYALREMIPMMESDPTLLKLATNDHPKISYEEYLQIKIPEEFANKWKAGDYEKRNLLNDMNYLKFTLNWDVPWTVEKDARFYYVILNNITPPPPKHAYHGTSVQIFDSVLKKGLNNANSEKIMHEGVMQTKVEGVTFRADDPEWVRSYALGAASKTKTPPTILRWKLPDELKKNKGEVGVFKAVVPPKDIEFAVNFGAKEDINTKDLTYYPITKAVPVVLYSKCWVVPVELITGEKEIKTAKIEDKISPLSKDELKEEKGSKEEETFKSTKSYK